MYATKLQEAITVTEVMNAPNKRFKHEVAWFPLQLQGKSFDLFGPWGDFAISFNLFLFIYLLICLKKSAVYWFIKIFLMIFSLESTPEKPWRRSWKIYYKN